MPGDQVMMDSRVPCDQVMMDSRVPGDQVVLFQLHYDLINSMVSRVVQSFWQVLFLVETHVPVLRANVAMTFQLLQDHIGGV